MPKATLFKAEDLFREKFEFRRQQEYKPDISNEQWILATNDDVILKTLEKIKNDELVRTNVHQNSLTEEEQIYNLSWLCKNLPNGFKFLPDDLKQELVNYTATVRSWDQMKVLYSVEVGKDLYYDGCISAIQEGGDRKFLYESVGINEGDGLKWKFRRIDDLKKELCSMAILQDIENIKNSQENELDIAIELKQYFETLPPINYFTDDLMDQLNVLGREIEKTLTKHNYSLQMDAEKIKTPSKYESMVNEKIALFGDMKFRWGQMKNIVYGDGSIEIIHKNASSPFLNESIVQKTGDEWSSNPISINQEVKDVYTNAVLFDLEEIGNSQQSEFAIALDCKKYLENMAPINYINDYAIKNLKEICFNMEYELRQSRYPHRLEFNDVKTSAEYAEMVFAKIKEFEQNQSQSVDERVIGD